MSRKYRLTTALDVDDLLLECTSYDIRLENEKYQLLCEEDFDAYSDLLTELCNK